MKMTGRKIFNVFVGTVISLFSITSSAATWEILGGTAYLYESDPSFTYNMLINPENSSFTDYEWPGNYFGTIYLLNQYNNPTARVDIGFDSFFVGEGSTPYVDLGENYADMSSLTLIFAGEKTSVGLATGDVAITNNNDSSYTISWSAMAYAGVFNASHWDMTLHVQEVQAVPIPAAIWLFGAGLLALIGASRPW